MHIATSPRRQRRRIPVRSPHFEILNAPADFDEPANPYEYFSLTAVSNTRLCRKTLTCDDLTAPMVVKRLRHQFVLCEVTVSGDFVNDWDQGGLVIFLGGHPANNQAPSTRFTNRQRYEVVDPQLTKPSAKWARVALELSNGELCVSSLAANPGCGVDWASTPAFPHLSLAESSDLSMPSLRLKLERVGKDLWVWYMNPDSWSPREEPTPDHVRRQWRKCREIVNFFDDENSKGDAFVGCFASRPVEAEDDHIQDGLFVEFEDLEIL